jgi:hypothetical protein
MSSKIDLDLTKKELENAYWNEKLSTRKIANKLGRSQRHVINLMKYYGVPRMGRIDAVIRGCKKFDKIPFSGRMAEKAYMMGLTFADFRRRMHGYQIDVTVSTTHPGLSALFKELFSKYSPVRERPRFNKKTGKFGWTLESQLHPSFSFLLGDKQIPEWIETNDTYFLHFFAGYVDGEGTISICKNSSRCVAFILRIASEDKEILSSIYEWLKRNSYSPSLNKVRNKGDWIRFYDTDVRCSNDHWALRLKRKNDVIKLLEILPIRHTERTRKRNCMMQLKNSVYQKDVNVHWQKIKDEIKAEVEEYARLSERRIKRVSSPS